jgi:hypothetical protein
MKSLRHLVCCLAALSLLPALAQNSSHMASELHLRILQRRQVPAAGVPLVAWLDPAKESPALAFSPAGNYRLLQKNRTFVPHVQVVPVGATVAFPNADPFFHNVFSLFDGKRFDLGLYEAGSSKSVTFSREGVSYIFCNIHPEMSAVIISVPSRLYALSKSNQLVSIADTPPGDYRLHVWVEGVPQSLLDSLTRPVHLDPGVTDLPDIRLPIRSGAKHTNEFGQSYEPQPEDSPY